MSVDVYACPVCPGDLTMTVSWGASLGTATNSVEITAEMTHEPPACRHLEALAKQLAVRHRQVLEGLIAEMQISARRGTPA